MHLNFAAVVVAGIAVFVFAAWYYVALADLEGASALRQPRSRPGPRHG
jgi:hypothetical protein